MTTYTTKQGDVLDAVVSAYYGRTFGVVELVLESNRALGLADLGPVLPAGLVIELPEIEPPASPQPTRLWE